MERTYTIPLRKETMKAPTHKRAKKAVIAVKRFVSRHMKADEVKIGPELNAYLWAKGIEHPPGKVTLAVRAEEGKAYANLVGTSLEAEKIEQKSSGRDDNKNLLEKQVEKLKGVGKKEESEAKPAEEEKKEEKAN